MTDEEIKHKGFLVVWKVLRGRQPPSYFAAEEYVRQYMVGEITEEEFESIYPEGVSVVVEVQKERNLVMFVAAILTTSDDRFEQVKKLNLRKIDKLRGNKK